MREGFGGVGKVEQPELYSCGRFRPSLWMPISTTSRRKDNKALLILRDCNKMACGVGRDAHIQNKLEILGSFLLPLPIAGSHYKGRSVTEFDSAYKYCRSQNTPANL
nr:hypothetical protein CFP56_03127 [Quercus suber]